MVGLSVSTAQTPRSRGTLPATMTTPSDALTSYLAAHPDCARFEVYVVDTNGIWRGKWLDAQSARKLYAGTLKLPLTTMALDVWGNDIAEIVFENGDSDGLLAPVPQGLRAVPWAAVPTAQVQAHMLHLDGTPYDGDPRNVLTRVQRRLTDRGLMPVVALELEFYLVPRDREPHTSPAPAPTHIHGHRVPGPHTYGIEALAGFDAVLLDIERACKAQGVPTHACIKEAAAAQFEINLDHRPDAHVAADDAVCLKRAIKETALRHGLIATFMAKPFADLAGNGLHAHVSLVDGNGANVFDDRSERGSPTLQHAIGGLCATMSDAMAIFAPGINSFRRFQPGRHAPTAPTWGYENRTTAIRVPGGDPAAIRVEHRVAGADANPYLLLAAILAGIDSGLAERTTPPPPIEGNAYDAVAVSLPTSWPAAIERFERSELIARCLGRSFQRFYSATKRQELAAFAGHVTPFEWDTYVSLA